MYATFTNDESLMLEHLEHASVLLIGAHAGRRQSRIDFHSFRRWFIRKAIDALHRGAKGYDQWTIADVVGHDREPTDAGLGMTMGRYPGEAPVDAKRTCVAAVKLPRRANKARN